MFFVFVHDRNQQTGGVAVVAEVGEQECKLIASCQMTRIEFEGPGEVCDGELGVAQLPCQFADAQTLIVGFQMFESGESVMQGTAIGSQAFPGL